MAAGASEDDVTRVNHIMSLTVQKLETEATFVPVPEEKTLPQERMDGDEIPGFNDMSVECHEDIKRNLSHAHHERKRLGKKSKHNEGEIEKAVCSDVFGGISLQGSCVWRFPELVKWTTRALGSQRKLAIELTNWQTRVERTCRPQEVCTSGLHRASSFHRFDFGLSSRILGSCLGLSLPSLWSAPSNCPEASLLVRSTCRLCGGEMLLCDGPLDGILYDLRRVRPLVADAASVFHYC